MKKCIAFILPVLFLAPMIALAEKMIFVTDGQSPPLVFKDNGKFVGSDVEIVTEICKRAGIEPEIHDYPLKRALMMTEKGEAAGIFTIFRTEERDQFLYFPEETINTVRTMVIGRKYSGFRINSLEDLRDKAIGVMDGRKYGPEFDNIPGLKKEFLKTKEQMILMLNKGRVDVILNSEEPFKHEVRKMGIEDKFEMLYLVRENPVYVAFSKTLGEKGEKLSKVFSEALKQMKADGTYEKILNKYR